MLMFNLYKIIKGIVGIVFNIKGIVLFCIIFGFLYFFEGGCDRLYKIEFFCIDSEEVLY